MKKQKTIKIKVIGDHKIGMSYISLSIGRIYEALINENNLHH